MSDPAGFEARLRALEEPQEILRTMYQYAHALDYGARDEFLDCFTDDGVWTNRFRQQEGAPASSYYEGRTGLGQFFDRHTHAPALYHKHLLVEPRITLKGDEAHVISYWVRIDEHADGPYLRGFGRYLDVLLREHDGRWRIKRREVEVEAIIRKT